MSIAIVILALVFGVAIGFVCQTRVRFIRFFSEVATYSIYVLLFFLGAGLGHNEIIFSQLPTLGWVSLILCLPACIGSIVAVALVQRYFPQIGEKRESTHSDVVVSQTSPFAATIKILCCFVVGVAAARLSLLPVATYSFPLVEYSLWVLVFSIGVGLGTEVRAFSIVKEMPVLILSVPLLTIVGSLAGAVAASVFLPDITTKEALIVASGLGYYTLTSVLVDQSGHASLAVVALLCNMGREILGIIATPYLARYCGSLSPVAIAAAPAMDTCLPVIVRYTNEKVAIVAVISGVVHTFTVPLLVLFFLNL